MKEKFVISIISQLIIQISTLLSNYFLVLFLDVELMGIWALLNSIISIGFIFNDLGLISIHYQYSQKKNFDEYFSSFFALMLILTVINIIFSLILIMIFNLWESVYFVIVLLLLLSNIVSNFLNIISIHLRGKLKVFKVQIPLLIITTCQNSFKLFIAFNITIIQNPLFWISITLFLFNMLNSVLVIILGKKDIKLMKPNKAYMLEYLKDTKHLMVFTIFSVIVANIGNVILAYSFDYEILAHFYIVTGYILPFITIFSSSMISLCMPLYSIYFSEGEISKMNRVVHTIEKYVSIIISCIIILVFLIGDKIFSIFLPNYTKSLPILYIMVFTSYLEGINRNYAILLISGKKQKLSAKMSVFFMVFKLILFILLIPQDFLIFRMIGLGGIGYALALLIPTIIFTTYIRPLIKKLFEIKIQKEIVLHLPLSLVVILIVYILKIYIIERFISHDILLIIIISLISLGVFFGELFIFKILKKDDIVFFLKLLKLRNYKISIKEEF